MPIDLIKIIELSKKKTPKLPDFGKIYASHLLKGNLTKTTYNATNRSYGCLGCNRSFHITSCIGDTIYIHEDDPSRTYHIKCALRKIGIKI